MASEPKWRLRITSPARRDIAAIIRWSYRQFGELASLRYEALMLQAISDIAADPERAGTSSRPELMLDGVRTYHLSFRRERMAAPRVRTPRHLLVYRSTSEGVIELARVLHDSRDLPRHLPITYRR